jgi:hypothetical protein
LLFRLALRLFGLEASSTAFILRPVNSFIRFLHSLSDQDELPSDEIRPDTSNISRYPYLLCLGMANMSDRTSRTLATSLPGRPYRANVSQVGKRKRRSISKPDTAGWVSGMMKTKPSVVDGGSE